MSIDRLFIKGPADSDFVAMDEEYGLHLKWRVISAPTPKTLYDDIPGMNGSLDSTGEFGEVFYHDRTLSLDCKHPSDLWQEDFENFMCAYHGQDCKIAFSSDPDYYWIGRLTVTQYDTKDHSLQMSAVVYPYKFKKVVTEIVTNVRENVYTTTRLDNGRMRVVPEITFTAPITIKWGTNTRELSSSDYPSTVRIPGMEIMPNTFLYVTAKGDAQDGATVTFSYREGSL